MVDEWKAVGNRPVDKRDLAIQVRISPSFVDDFKRNYGTLLDPDWRQVRWILERVAAQGTRAMSDDDRGFLHLHGLLRFIDKVKE